MDFSLMTGTLSSLIASISAAKAALEIRDFNNASTAIADLMQKLLNVQQQLSTLQADHMQLQEQLKTST